MCILPKIVYICEHIQIFLRRKHICKWKQLSAPCFFSTESLGYYYIPTHTDVASAIVSYTSLTVFHVSKSLVFLLWWEVLFQVLYQLIIYWAVGLSYWFHCTEYLDFLAIIHKKNLDENLSKMRKNSCPRHNAKRQTSRSHSRLQFTEFPDPKIRNSILLYLDFNK